MNRARPLVLVSSLAIACTLTACDSQPRQVEATSTRTVTVETPDGPKDFESPFGTERPDRK